MQVDVFVEGGLRCSPDRSVPVLRLALSYRDEGSVTVREALDRVWRIVNGAPHVLAADEMLVRRAWDAVEPGTGVSVGDVVAVDGRRWRCVPSGWVPVAR